MRWSSSLPTGGDNLSEERSLSVDPPVCPRDNVLSQSLCLAQGFAAPVTFKKTAKQQETKEKQMKYHHLGIPSTEPLEDEQYLPEYRAYASGYKTSAYCIERMRYEEGGPLPEIVKTMPHIAFEVEDVGRAIEGKKVIIEPNSPSEGVLVAFIEENGVPIEFIQFRG